MLRKEKYIVIFAIFLFMLAFLLITAQSCMWDPLVKYVIENQTEDELTIFIKDYKSNDLEVGKVKPGKQIIDEHDINIVELHYVAKNAAGKIVFDKKLTREQMQEISSLEYKIVIKLQ